MKGMKTVKLMKRRAGTAFTWLPGFAGLGLWEIATRQDRFKGFKGLVGRYHPQTAGPPQAAAT